MIAMPPSLPQGVVCVVAAEIAQTAADGQTHVAVVDTLTICDLLLGQPSQVVGADVPDLSEGGVGKDLPQGSDQPVLLDLFLRQHDKLLWGRAVFQSVVLCPVVGVQRVVDLVMELTPFTW